MANVRYPENWLKDMADFVNNKIIPNDEDNHTWYICRPSNVGVSTRQNSITNERSLKMEEFFTKLAHFISFISVGYTVDTTISYDHRANDNYFGLFCHGAYTGLIMIRSDGSISSHT